MTKKRLTFIYRIYSEKLRRVEIEMKMIQEGTHPEYVAQKACIDQKLDERVRLADAQYKYGMESLDTATRVSKAQVHSQYFQRVRELRENTLNKCSELWYHIQRERRAGDTLVSGLFCLGFFLCGKVVVTQYPRIHLSDSRSRKH